MILPARLIRALGVDLNLEVTMKSILAALLLAALTPPAFGQTVPQPEPAQAARQGSSAPREMTDLPLAKRSFRPKLSLQHALKLAEKYIGEKRINISPYFLREAKYVLFGGEGDKEPAWFFWWVNENGSMGDYVQILVFINSGEIRRVPSM